MGAVLAVVLRDSGGPGGEPDTARSSAITVEEDAAALPLQARGEAGLTDDLELQGYASEAVTALTEWALQNLGAMRVELVTDEQNLGSRGVAERCGFRLEGIQRNVARSPDGRLRSNCIYARMPAEHTPGGR